MAKLSNKQKKFCEEYIIDLNATQAAIRASYSEISARQVAARLLTKDDIKEYLSELMGKRSKRTQIDQDYVISVIVDTIERCRQAEPVKDASGEPTGQYVFDATNVLKATDQLCKHLGMYNINLKANITTKSLPCSVEEFV